MIIRPAGIEDVGTVSALWKSMVNELAPDYTPNVEWWEGMCLNLMEIGIYHMFVAEDEGKIVGFIDGLAYPEPSTGKQHGVGQHFYVLPEYRGTSVGPRLYREIIRLAREKGARVMEFFCFADGMGSWRRKGYRPVRVLMRRD